MLKKMGWSQGEGLGKDRTGDVDPLTLDIKMDKKGLVAAEEAIIRRRGKVLTMTGVDLSGKHPVTALMELSTRRRWGAPNFVQAFECGPSHKKQYVYKVRERNKCNLFESSYFCIICQLLPPPYMMHCYICHR